MSSRISAISFGSFKGSHEPFAFVARFDGSDQIFHQPTVERRKRPYVAFSGAETWNCPHFVSVSATWRVFAAQDRKQPLLMKGSERGSVPSCHQAMCHCTILCRISVPSLFRRKKGGGNFGTMPDFWAQILCTIPDCFFRALPLLWSSPRLGRSFSGKHERETALIARGGFCFRRIPRRSVRVFSGGIISIK